ncbi:MAG TPA: methionine synthase, partial [Methylomirabilota bacterium]
MASLPLIPSAVIGSHGKPGWWFATVKKVEAGEYGPGDLDEMFDDAADTAIRDMERAGLDIITDGEVRRLDGYVDSYYAIIKGISPLPVRRKAGPWGYDQQTRYEATGRIETPEGGLGIVKEFEYLKAHTAKATKATCAGPLTFGSRIHPGKMYKGVVDVAERFAEVINVELKGLVAAGADFIQLDEPARGNVSGEEMARLYNMATEGVKAKLGFHICFGNRFGRSRFDRTYRPYFPGILKARADQLVLEFAGREFSEL